MYNNKYIFLNDIVILIVYKNYFEKIFWSKILVIII